MFKKISENKAQYEKGQLFPFLTALIVVVLIFIMITVNLGQINTFKIDVSNAADAGALAGASVLSSALLGLGLKSDQMAGYATVTLAAMFISFLRERLPHRTAMSLLVTWVSKGLAAWLQAKGEGRMAWTNSKQTALSYAFNNAGVDEPRPSFKQFMNCAYYRNPNASDTAAYKEYVTGESPNTRRCGRPGFSKFMEDSHKGYWSDDNFAKVDPSDSSPGTCKNGYGWSQNSDGTFRNSYTDNIDNIAQYINGGYDNYVEAEVIGSSSYDIKPYMLSDTSGLRRVTYVMAAIIFIVQWLKHGNKLRGLKYGAASSALFLASVRIPFYGLKMNISQEVDRRPIQVSVKRFKRAKNLGLWNFRYGSGVRAQAQARAFNDNSPGEKTISPLFLEGLSLGRVLSFNFSDLGNTDLHLFETELTYTN